MPVPCRHRGRRPSNIIRGQALLDGWIVRDIDPVIKIDKLVLDSLGIEEKDEHDQGDTGP